jgi:hypothetical protein
MEGESMSALHQTAAVKLTERVIRRLAERNHVAYFPTANDVLVNHITRLAGDDVELDPIEQMVIALQRAGHLSRVQAVRLQARYLREINL